MAKQPSTKKKTVCSLSSKEAFLKGGKPVKIVIDGKEFTATPREFSTGSLGYNVSGKVDLDTGAGKHNTQVACNLIIVGSADIPENEKKAA